MAAYGIGDVVEQLEDEFSDVTISKIRFLETQGLVTPQRAASGYRRYSATDVAQLRWVLRQQRDHFLPLRVIRERLSTGRLTDEDFDELSPPTSMPRVDPMTRPDSDTEFRGKELTERSGLGVEALAAMEKFGLVSPVVRRGRPVYGSDDLIAARLVARFLDHGIEPRHLRSFKVAADREANLIGQRLSTVTDPVEHADAMAELIRLGEDLRSLLLRQIIHEETP